MPSLPYPDPELADDGIRLRPPAPADVPAITAGCQDPLVQRFTFVIADPGDVTLLAPWALRTLGLARVTLDIDVDNAASQRVAERAGFTRVGVLRSAIEVKGRRWTVAVYSLLAEELP
jgi:hypothetical protein